MDETTRSYLARIGRKGGRKSRRKLDPETAREMVRIREAKRAFRRFHASCFWSSPADLAVGREDIPWVAESLMKYGDREAWRIGRSLCP